jgi:hypothetical protein
MLALACVCCGCSSQQPGLDGRSADVVVDAPSHREGLVFLKDGLVDRAKQSDGSDRGAHDVGRDKTSPDKTAPSPDQTPISPCRTDWSKWACAPNALAGCTATCSGYVLNCIPPVPLPGVPMACTCTKGGSSKTCTGSGLVCAACGDAFSSCCKM